MTTKPANAANAYPRLVEALRFLVPIAQQMEEWNHERGATTMIRLSDDSVRDAVALLRELGEL